MILHKLIRHETNDLIYEGIATWLLQAFNCSSFVFETNDLIYEGIATTFNTL